MEWYEPALNTLSSSGSNAIFGPVAFQSYLRENRLSVRRYPTQATISLDDYYQLPQALRDRHTMVLRLGRASSSAETQFVLVRIEDRLKDFCSCLTRMYFRARDQYSCPQPRFTI